MIRRMRWLEEHPMMRDGGFTTQITVKTAGASHAVVEFVERNCDMLLAGLRCFDRADPANPLPPGTGRNFLP